MVYVFAFLIVIGTVLNILSKKYILYNLTYKREISKRVVETDEEFDIVTVVENKKILPVTFLQVTEEFPSVLKYKYSMALEVSREHISHKTTMLVLPFERIKRTYKVFCSKRGRYIFRDAYLTGGDLLGLDTVTRSTEYSQDIIVLPKSADLENEIIPYGDYNGDFSVKRWIIDDPVMITGVREYTGSEPERLIHWPSTLRSGKLMVKKFDYTSDNTALIILNIECFKPFWADIREDKIEKCISITRSVMELFEGKGIPYELISNACFNGTQGSGNMNMPGFGPTHFYNSLESLGGIDYSISIGFDELLLNQLNSGMKYTTCIMITPSVLEPYIEPINMVSGSVMRTVLISLDEDNLNHLESGIITCIERRN